MNVGKNGIITASSKTVSNLYTGEQFNNCNMVLTYNYETDIFKDYGFDTCMRIKPPSEENINYRNPETKQFLSYSYLIDATVQYDPGQEYVVSLYAYVSEDCNADFRLKLENYNIWLSNYQGTASNIVDKTKGKVIWVWGRCKANSNGTIYIMFYPNPSLTNVFTTGYQLFTGITIYKGNEVLRPMNNSVSGSGFIETIQNEQLKVNKNFMIAKDFIEL